MWIVPWDPFLIFFLNKVTVGPINSAWTVLNSTWTTNFVRFKIQAPKKKKIQIQNSNMDPNPHFLVESGYTRQKVSWKRRKEKRKINKHNKRWYSNCHHQANTVNQHVQNFFLFSFSSSYNHLIGFRYFLFFLLSNLNSYLKILILFTTCPHGNNQYIINL